MAEGTTVREVVRIGTSREFAVSNLAPLLTTRRAHAAVYHSQQLFVLGVYHSQHLYGELLL
jgi:hypothetical protein